MKIKLNSIFVDNQTKALKFYTEVLGFKKSKEIPGRLPVIEAVEMPVFRIGVSSAAISILLPYLASFLFQPTTLQITRQISDLF